MGASGNKLLLEVQIQGEPYQQLIDSGASLSLCYAIPTCTPVFAFIYPEARMTSLDHKTLAVVNNAKGNQVRLRHWNTE